MNDMHKGDFGRFVADARRRAQLTQRELAARIFVTESAVSKWERGLSYPDIATLRSLAGALQVTEGELVTASEDRRGRRDARQARSHRRWRAGVLIGTSAVYAATLLACLVVNLSVQHTLSWSWIVLGAVALAFSLTTLPLLVRRRRGWAALAGALVSLAAMLGAVELLYGGGFYRVTMASVLLGAVLVWGPLLVRSFGTPGLRRHAAVLALAADTVALLLFLWLVLDATGQGAWFGVFALPVAAMVLGIAWSVTLVLRYLPVGRLRRAAVALVLGAAFFTAVPPAVDVLLTGAPYRFRPFDLLRWESATIGGNVNALVVLTMLAGAVVVLALSAVPERTGGGARRAS
ncbi:helix-turn-helix domain-containing protein [Rothia sp. AR01]|uniref:Helix-turn-helix domain-containing protein n=1 Tax=Rothia santali TaxID=2949643 RepID=A0A9X2HC55_9MICC|nr:helix-turn-helix transcriptional regulator [Rothia santali]MCP3426929.1 helix-turn-helix domain-containing protein [Rothia santali]